MSEIFNAAVAEYAIRTSISWLSANPVVTCGAVVLAGLVLVLRARRR